MRAMLKREIGKKKRVPKQTIITGLKLITETDFNFVVMGADDGVLFRVYLQDLLNSSFDRTKYSALGCACLKASQACDASASVSAS
ncbi:hypothetical protein HG66A1_44850 [Gimesia chilikensis]|uniref:Uncharacterized protein n=1 Tax=Gimesia chilikensis TaxID=2605989 RepID=A0A517PTH1_9PLAN|nr:hypothetical protein HG66A1_44850 [Gimesia chilikensis]